MKKERMTKEKHLIILSRIANLLNEEDLIEEEIKELLNELRDSEPSTKHYFKD